jgi:hypothetical protein
MPLMQQEYFFASLLSAQKKAIFLNDLRIDDKTYEDFSDTANAIILVYYLLCHVLS